MKTIIKRPIPFTSSEKKSAEFLMQKMNISKKELREIGNMYGVSFSKIVELMRLCKYEFIVKEGESGYCNPCTYGRREIIPEKFGQRFL